MDVLPVKMCNLESESEATPFEVKKVLRVSVAEVLRLDRWRIPYLATLMEQRGENHFQMRDTSEMTDLIDSLCVS